MKKKIKKGDEYYGFLIPCVIALLIIIVIILLSEVDKEETSNINYVASEKVSVVLYDLNYNQSIIV